jgi:HSP20 family protein
MSMIRWNPILGATTRDLATFQDEVHRLFDGFLQRSPLRGEVAQTFTPAVDIAETADEFVVSADLPGLSQKDVKVNLMGDTLTIRGERKHESVRNDHNYHRLERTIGTFERSFTFGTPVKNEGIRAQYRDGVLEIRVPKAEEAKLREIEVQVAS